jgi:hypothetical protein
MARDLFHSGRNRTQIGDGTWITLRLYCIEPLSGSTAKLASV